MSVQLPFTQRSRAATLYKTTYLDGGEIRLFKASFSPTPANLLADFDAAQADYGGYAAGTVTTWGSVFQTLAGLLRSIAPSHQFTWTGAPDNSLGGYYYVKAIAAVDTLIHYEVFPVPIPIAAASTVAVIVAVHDVGPLAAP